MASNDYKCPDCGRVDEIWSTVDPYPGSIACPDCFTQMELIVK